MVMELVEKKPTEDLISSLSPPVSSPPTLSLPEHPEYSYVAVTMQLLCAAT